MRRQERAAAAGGGAVAASDAVGIITCSPESRALLTYANQLTILRIAAIPFFVLLLVYGYPGAATAVFVLAGVTDGLDGLIARRLRQKTALGSFLDPMADKLLMTAAFVTLTIPTVPVKAHIPAWLTILSISRDLLIALFALLLHLRLDVSQFPPSLLGKCTTAVQLFTVGLCLFVNFLPDPFLLVFDLLVYATLLLTIASVMHYLHRSFRLIEKHQRALGGP
ncbi:MAG: CDP-alcohol phosphatidyltransferase family protein [Acidobacteria bacterium]|nr:CDP-alcohol phosphatidyltransferase family protein [Acidobacteriota bacterium]